MSDDLYVETSNDKVSEKTLFQPFDPDEQIDNKVARDNSELLFIPQTMIVHRKYVQLGCSWHEAILLTFFENYYLKGKRIYFTNKHISQLLEVSETTASNVITSLTKKGLIRCKYKRKANGGQFRFIEFEDEKPTSRKLKLQLQDSLSSNFKKVEGNNTNINNTNINTTLELKFSEFWELYPKKIAKANALKVFSRLPEGLRKIAAEGVRTFAFPDDPKFIPYPATWLSQHRWEDSKPQNNSTFNFSI